MGIVEIEDAAWLLAMRDRHPPAPAVFVETGTLYGRLARLALDAFTEVHTIELSPELVDQYHADLAGLGARCWEGDSANIVPRLAGVIYEPVFWYLDAHWFDSPDVAKSPLPLMRELEAIAGRPYKDVIVVDDVNCFGHGPQEEWNEISIIGITDLFPGCREAVVLGDQLVIYR